MRTRGFQWLPREGGLFSPLDELPHTSLSSIGQPWTCVHINSAKSFSKLYTHRGIYTYTYTHAYVLVTITEEEIMNLRGR